MKLYVEPKLEICPNGLEKCSWWDAYRLGLIKYADYWHKSKGLPQNMAFYEIYGRYVRRRKIVYPWEAIKFVDLFINKYHLNMPRWVWQVRTYGSVIYKGGVYCLYGAVLGGDPPKAMPKNLEVHFLKRTAINFNEISKEIIVGKVFKEYDMKFLQFTL
jgi:hypothetical protein